MIVKFFRFLMLFFIAAPMAVYAQPSNDNCTSAISFGTLDRPVTCPPQGSGTGLNQGNTTTLQGTNVGATSSAPYPYIANCTVNNNSLPKDVWYSFIATGYQTQVSLSNATGTLTDPSITVWTGTCGSLEGVGCVSGAGSSPSVLIYQTVIGQTYYIQIAGADSTQTGTFDLSIACANNCNTCVIQSYITPSVPPVNGTYNPGQTVTFCYTITQYQEIGINWLHGVTVTFGKGWDSTSLVVGSPPPSCTPTSGAYWGWFPNGDSSGSTIPPGGIGPPFAIFGPGFYYETTANAPCGCIDSIPGDNFGDEDAGQGTCSPTFCITLTVGAHDTAGSDLSINFATTGDGQSGNYNTPGCGAGIDSGGTFYAVTSCSAPILHPLISNCGQANGQDTAIAVGNYAPYIFHWSTGYSDTGRVSVITSLAPGIYTVTVINSVGCVVTVRDTVSIQGPPNGGPTHYVSCPSLIDTVVMAGIGIGRWSALSTNPASTIIDHIDSPNTVIRSFSTLGTYSYVWTVGFCSDTVSIIVSSRPNAGPDVYTCVNGTATMAAIGTGTWAALPGNPSPTTITNPVSNTTTITGFTVGGTYSYVWYVGTCADTASVIIPAFVSSATVADTLLCKYQSTSITATAGPAALSPFTYAWSPASAVTSPTSANTGTKPLLAPTIYILTVTSISGCKLYDTVSVNVAGAAPRVSISPSDNNVCPGDTITLSSQTLAENLVYCGIVDTCVTNNSLVSIAVNNDTSSTTGSFGFTGVYCSPFMGSINSYKAQYLFTRAELNAAGLSSGSITDISFYVKTVNSTAGYDTFTVSMGCTAEDSLTGFISNLQEVLPPQYGPNAIFPNQGWTPLPFVNFYNWDGSSNIVIQICYTINNNLTSDDDFVSYTTTSYNGSTVLAGDEFLENVNGCSLDSTADLYLILNTRPNVKFGQCVPNVLTYQWSPHTILCDTCPVTQVVVNANTTYTLTVNDNGCSNDTLINLIINPNIGVTATPAVATACGGNGVQLNVGLSSPPASQCIQGYRVDSIAYSPIAGTATIIQPGSYIDDFGFPDTDDGTAGPFGIGFNFQFYCEAFSQFYVNTNGWITFEYPYPATTEPQEYTAVNFPTTATNLDPQKTIELLMGNYYLADGNGNGLGSIGYFMTGTTPNRILVVQFINMGDEFTTSLTSGEMHLYESTGIIDILLTSSDYSGTDHTTGINDSIGLGLAAPGMNNQLYTISTPVAWRFTPDFGPSVAITSTVWSPDQYLNNDTITNPIASPPTAQTYIVTDTLVINQYTNPTQCVVKDTVQINIGHTGGGTVAVSPATICPGGSTQLTFTSPDTITSYSWTPATGLSGTTISDPQASVTDTTTYYVTAVNTQGCQITDTVTVNTAPVPTALLPKDSTACNCTPAVTVSPTVTGGSPAYQYVWSDGSTGATTTDTSIGITVYTLTVTDANHCTAVSNTDTFTMSCPKATITVSPLSDTIFIHDTAILTASNTAGYTYQWISDSTILVLNPNTNSTSVIGQIAGRDTISLLVTDLNGCSYSAIQAINVVEFGNFAMATAFTPNGDGKNDYFYPAFNGPNSPVTVTKFNIYDRWGQLLYDNPNPPGWDGSLSGKQQPSETYIYFITLDYPDPNDASRTIQRSVQGSFQLFR